MRYLIGGAALLLAAVAAVTVYLLQAVLDEARLEARIAEAVLAWTGHPLVTSGGVDLKLLPQPVVTVHQPRLGRPEDGFVLRADRLDLDVAPLPLVTGTLLVEVATLVRPELQLLADPTAEIDAMAERLTASSRQLPIRRLAFTGGALATGDGAVLWRDIEGLLEREGEAGGSRLSLRGRSAAAETPVTLGLESRLGSALPTRPVPVQLSIEAMTGAVTDRLEFRGQLRAEPSGSDLAGQLTLDLSPSATPLGAVLAALWPDLLRSPLPELQVALAGDLSLALGEGPTVVRLEQASLELAGQALTGSLQLEAGRAPSVDLRLDADRLILPDAIADPSDLASHLADLLPPALRGSIELRAAVVEWRAGTLRQVDLDLVLDGMGMVDIARATAVLPGPGDLAFSGRYGPLAGAAAPRLTGRLEAALQAPGELAAAFIEPPALLQGSATLALQTDLEWQPPQLTLQNTDLRLDALQALGGLAFRQAPAGGLPQVAVWTSIDRLALDEVSGATSPAAALDQLLGLAASTDLAIDMRIARTSLGEARFGSLTARLDSSDGAVAIERLSLNDIAGSAATVSGRAHAPSRTFELDLAVDVASLSRLVRLAGGEPPIAMALLGPLNIRGGLAGDLDRMEVSATLDADLFTGRGVASITGWRERPAAAVEFSLEAVEADALLRQLGGMASTGPLLQGPLTAEAQLDVGEGGLRAAVLDLALGDLGVGLDASRASSDPGPLDRFGLRLGPLSGETAALLYRLATPLLDFVPGPPERWLGYWPAQTLRWGWLQAHEAEIALTVFGTDPDAPPIEIKSQLENGTLTVPAFRWAGEAGLIDGGMALVARDDGARADLTLDLALERFAADSVLTAMGARAEALSGTLDLGARLETHGRSVRELIGNLDGTAALVLTEGALGAASATAGGLPVERLDAGLVVDRGVIRPVPEEVRFFGPDGTGVLDGYLDLLAWIVDLELTLDGHDGSPLLRQRFFGPLGDPTPLGSPSDAVEGRLPAPAE